MWDSKAPLQLLSSMPKKLSKENLEKLQMVIDADKYKNSLLCGFDLCEMYAPFCRDCKKTGIYPCAIAYINMLRAGGADLEIDAKPVNTDLKQVITETPVQADNNEQQTNTSLSESTIADAQVREEAVVPEAVKSASTEEAETTYIAEEPYVPAPAEEEIACAEQRNESFAPAPVQTQKEPLKRKIRIAVARKKL